MREVKVALEPASEEVLRRGLEELGLELSNISDEQLGKMLTYAIGYVDYSNASIVKEMLNYSEEK